MRALKKAMSLSSSDTGLNWPDRLDEEALSLENCLVNASCVFRSPLAAINHLRGQLVPMG